MKFFCVAFYDIQNNCWFPLISEKKLIQNHSSIFAYAEKIDDFMWITNILLSYRTHILTFIWQDRLNAYMCEHTLVPFIYHIIHFRFWLLRSQRDSRSKHTYFMGPLSRYVFVSAKCFHVCALAHRQTDNIFVVYFYDISFLGCLFTKFIPGTYTIDEKIIMN